MGIIKEKIHIGLLFLCPSLLVVLIYMGLLRGRPELTPNEEIREMFVREGYENESVIKRLNYPLIIWVIFLPWGIIVEEIIRHSK